MKIFDVHGKAYGSDKRILIVPTLAWYHFIDTQLNDHFTHTCFNFRAVAFTIFVIISVSILSQII